MLTPDDITKITAVMGSLDLSLRELTLALKEHTVALAAAPRSTAPATDSRPRPYGDSTEENPTYAKSTTPARVFNGDWRVFCIPFGKKAGLALGGLPSGSLRWWIENYKAEGYKGNAPRESDLAFRAALDAAAKDSPSPTDPQSQPQSSAASRGERPLEQQGNLVNRDGSPAVDEDVPF